MTLFIAIANTTSEEEEQKLKRPNQAANWLSISRLHLCKRAQNKRRKQTMRPNEDFIFVLIVGLCLLVLAKATTTTATATNKLDH